MADPEGRRGGEKLGGAEGGETLIRIHCMKNQSIINKREKRKKKTLMTKRISLYAAPL